MDVGVDPNIDPQQTLNIPTNQLQSHYEKQQKVNETLKPDSKEEKVNKTQQLVVLSKETKIKQLVEWVGNSQVYCSGNFEFYSIILKYLNSMKLKSDISSFPQLFKTLNSYDGITFENVYNYLYDVFTGKEYLKLVDNREKDINDFISEQQKHLKTESFRKFILTLCRFEYNKNLKKDINYATTIATKYSNISTEETIKSIHPWSEKIKYSKSLPDFTNFTNDQLLIFYQLIFKNYTTIKSTIQPTLTIEDIPSQPSEDTTYKSKR